MPARRPHGPGQTLCRGHHRTCTAAADFGILSHENCLPMWDWVGGRYSVWSAIGLSLSRSPWVGRNFEALLAGRRGHGRPFPAMQSTGADNMPLVLIALLESLVQQFSSTPENHVVLPYDGTAWQRLPDFLQQLTMESNGKSGQHGMARLWTTTTGACSVGFRRYDGTTLLPPVVASGHIAVPGRFRDAADDPYGGCTNSTGAWWRTAWRRAVHMMVGRSNEEARDRVTSGARPFR